MHMYLLTSLVGLLLYKCIKEYHSLKLCMQNNLYRINLPFWGVGLGEVVLGGGGGGEVVVGAGGGGEMVVGAGGGGEVVVGGEVLRGRGR